MSAFRNFPSLTRLPVSVAVTFTAFTAMVMAPDPIAWKSLLSVAGIFLLASGASAFNQYQEWPWDEKMERTRRRPLPARRISTADALRISAILIIAGMLLLMQFSPGITAGLGFINILWYNGLYTYLKRKTAFAVVPGALTGAVPVLMGWAAGGGDISAPVPLFLAFFLFMWQMPHFWLLTLKYGDEYRAAGFPTLADHFSSRQIRWVVMAWIIAASAASFLMVWFGILGHPATGYPVAVMNLALIFLMAWQLLIAGRLRYRLIFASANLFMLGVMIALIADKLIR